MLNIVVLVRFGLDVSELRADPRTGEPRPGRHPWRVDPFSEHAMEAAARLKERHGGSVRLLSLVPGPPQEDLLLRLLAVGADEAVLLQDAEAEGMDALGVACLLAAALDRMAPWDLLLCGDAAADRYESQVGPRVAAELGLPSLTRVTSLELDGDLLVAERSIEAGTEVVEVEPAVLVTVGQEINEPRLPPLLAVLAAGSKPRSTWHSGDLDTRRTTAPGGVRVLSLHAPPSRRAGRRVPGKTPAETAEALLELLQREGLVGP